MSLFWKYFGAPDDKKMTLSNVARRDRRGRGIEGHGVVVLLVCHHSSMNWNVISPSLCKWERWQQSTSIGVADRSYYAILLPTNQNRSNDRHIAWHKDVTIAVTFLWNAHTRHITALLIWHTYNPKNVTDLDFRYSLFLSLFLLNNINLISLLICFLLFVSLGM